MYEVIFYKTRDGKEPIVDYIFDLKEKSKTSKNEKIILEKILTYIKALKEYGTRAGMPIVKHIDGNLWELRPLKNRIFFFYWRDDTFVLLHYFAKKTNKTPVREIDQARRNLKDFLERSI